MTALPPHPTPAAAPRRRRLWQVVRCLLAGIAAGGHVAAAFELPVPSAVLAASGQVLPPVVSGNTMSIRQLSEQATLDWRSFNIGAENTVRFEQPQASSVALNRIHQADPSRIYGQLSANGQVYLVNQNGFVFGGGAQVNANTLVATTLDIADDTLKRGLTKVVDSAPAGGPVAALAGDGRVWRLGADGNPEKIAIRVEAGAEIKTNAGGGRILLAAPSLSNQGQIQANDGQVILAAATDKVYLQEADPSSGLRGVWVEVQTGGDIANLGKVLAERGNVSLIGYVLRQQGVVSASTSVALNGSVRLLAREGAALQQHNGAYTLVPQTTLRSVDNGDGLGTQASVTMVGGSRTGVDSDDSGGLAVDEQVQPRSRIDIEGGRITLEHGALIQAAHGQVNLTASASPDRPLAKTSADNLSRIELQAGSRIDVSGDSRTVLPMSRNIVNVELRSNELRDAPLQKTGVLYGKIVQVDVRAADKNGHIPIADISGALARIQRSVGERNAAGGTVNLASEGAALLNSGAEIDLSGGVIRYLGGFLNTTRLLGADGQLYDIAKADPLRAYPQIFGTFSKYWRRFGITETWDLPGPLRPGVYEPGYQEGRAAGSLNIQSREVLLEAAVLARTVDGILQRRERAAGGQLSIDTAWSGERQQAVTWGGSAAGQPAPLALSDAVFSAGLRHVRINSMGQITIAEGVAVQVPADGSLDLTGGEINILGSVYAPAGMVSLQTQPVAGNSPSLSGDIRLSADSRIDVSGQWINERPTQAGQTPQSLGALPIDGGQVTLYAQGGMDLAAGSQIKADGGAWLHVGETVAGQGGGISLKVAKPDGPSPLALGAELSSFALAQGGTLDITANALRLTTAPPTADSLNINPDLLENRGFSQIKLTANAGDLTVDEGLSLRLRMVNFDLPTRTTNLAATPAPTLIHLPDALRQPVSLSLALKQNPGVGGYQQDRALTLSAGAAINADPGATLSLSSDANIRLNGSLSAPAGRIDAKLEAAAYPTLPDYNPNQALALGPKAQLSAAGVALLEPNTQGLNVGEVRPGGAVALQAQRGYILMDRQARIDVSGTASPIDRFAEGGNRIGEIVRETVASAAGDIGLSAAEGIVLDGALSGRPGGPQVGGGRLTVELNAQLRAEPRADNSDISPNFPSGPRIVHLSAAAAAPPMPADWFAGAAIDTNRNGQAYWSAAQFAAGGFSALSLKSSVIVPAQLGAQHAGPEIGAIQFDGDVTLDAARSLVLDAPVFSADGDVVLRSSHAALGSTLNQHPPDLATSGAGQLRVEAGWIDLVGAVETQGISATALRSAADIRLIGVNPLQEADLQGEFVSPGDIALSARQIYPSTISQYRIAADGRIQIGPGDASAAVPLSAAGHLTLSAAQIESFGVLRAPFGAIDLQATDTLALQSGSLTSTAAGTALIPFGRTQGGLDWVFPIGAATRILSASPAQAISLSAPDIQFNAGATLDLSGGGDVSAFEFIPGPGGSVDYLAPASVGYQTSYAVLPGLSSAFAPYDPLEFPASGGLRMGDSVHLSGGNGLAAGDYALLPAHYALLPGAFLVTPQAGTLDQRPGVTPTRLDGVPIVAGYRYAQGTDERDSRWSGFAIEAGAVARTRSEFQETTASQFYAKLADDSAAAPPLLPKDAGHLSVAAGRALSLAGDLRAAGADGGRGGRLDIIADRLAIVPRRLPNDAFEDGAVRLSAEELNHLQVESLLLGGRRSETGETVRVDVSADRVTLSAGAQLQGPEILLAANSRVSLEAGAAISASGRLGGAPARLALDGDSALLRIAVGAQIDVDRTDSVTSQPGSLDLAAGATLCSDGAILLDAPGDFHLRGDILMRLGSLSLGASQISLGDAPADTPGLWLAAATLAQAQAEELRLRSLTALGLFGNVDFAARQILLDAPGISGHGAAGQTARLSAELIRLGNAANRPAPTADKQGAGRLALAARRLELDDGGFALNGFGAVEWAAADSLIAVGDAALAVGGNLRISAGQISSGTGASALLDAGVFAVDIANLAAGQPAAAGLGGALTIRGGDINDSGTIRLPAGRVNLHAAHSLTLSPGALIDVSGQAVSLGGDWHFAPGGNVSLSADGGDLTVQAGVRINVDGATQGGDAGAFSVQAANGTVLLDGEFSGHAQLEFTGGRLAVDTSRLAGGFSTLNVQAGQGGFNASLDVRVRQGDLLVAASDFVQSQAVRLSADSGDLTVDGIIDASGLSAGQVELYAGDQLRLSADARISAKASAPGQNGGQVSLSALDADGDGRAGVYLQTGASIDVSGGPGDAGGAVSVRAPRLGLDDAALDLAQGTVHGAARQTAEAVQAYRDLPLTNAQLAQWRTETAAFIDAAAQNPALQTRLGDYKLLPGLEIQSGGDLSLDLGERLNANPWTPLTTGASSIYYTQANDLAGAIAALRQISASGGIRTLLPAASASLNTDGSYFLDTDPASPTFRRLSVRVFPDNTQGANRYNPARIRDSLIEANGWDFLFPAADGAVWRFGPQQTPGILTLRAAGNLDIRQDLSDGFALYNARQLSEFFGLFGNWRDTWVLQTGDSWGYRLVAGADLAAADPLAVSHGLSTLTLGSGASIRTGTGNIDAASSGDIRLADQTASLYTAGRPDGQRYGVFDPSFVAQNFNAEYPVDGGNIRVQAGRDIIGAASTQLISDWLIRTGKADLGDGTGRPTVWGIAFDGIVAQNSVNDRIKNLKFGFQENIGVLGGGDVSIQAGRNIVDLSAMLPTSGKPLANNLAIQGGGDLTAQAGGDLFGGVFYVDRGTASITAGGNIFGGAQYSAGPVLALGDAQINVQARGNIAIGAALNPFFITQAKFTDKPAYFTTYTDASQIKLNSTGGDILFNNDLSVLRQQYKIFDAQSPRGRNVLNSFDMPLLGVYPGSLQAVALTGTMAFANSFSLYPSATGALELFAAHDISAAGNAESIAINQSDLGLAGLLSPALPAQSLNAPGNRLIIDRLYGSDVNPANLHATIPLRQGDASPVRIVSEYGSINAQNGLLITTAKPADIYAGLDIIGLSLQMQNVDDGAVSKIAAGRDIRYPIQRDPVSGDVLGASQAIEIAGQGQLWIMAGRDIDLGSSDGIRSVGNLLNPGLNAQGAELLVFAGLGHANEYAGLRRGEIADLFGILKSSAASAAASGEAAAKAAAYKTGYQAIQKLFPQANYLGDIKLFFSAIQTLDGGNISLLAPGGLINIGLPTAFSGNKTTDQLGIVAQRDGNIDIFALGDLQVNRSRVFALDGGDITVWSSLGDVDAGRGAKSALSAPLPMTGFDSFGNLVVTFPPTVSGSGIRAQAGTAGGHAGNVTLAAPKGIVDAGEAGIGGQNVVIAATAVIGANNIQVSGTSSGIPQTPAVLVMPVSAGNAMAAVGNTASTVAQAQPNISLSPQRDPVSLPNLVGLSTLTAEVLGFGNCSIADIQAGKTGC